MPSEKSYPIIHVHWWMSCAKTLASFCAAFSRVVSSSPGGWSLAPQKNQLFLMAQNWYNVLYQFVTLCYLNCQSLCHVNSCEIQESSLARNHFIHEKFIHENMMEWFRPVQSQRFRLALPCIFPLPPSPHEPCPQNPLLGDLVVSQHCRTGPMHLNLYIRVFYLNTCTNIISYIYIYEYICKYFYWIFSRTYAFVTDLCFLAL